MTPEIWPFLIFMYIIVAAVVFFAGVAERNALYGSNRRLGAQMMLLAPVWVLAALFLVGRGIVRLFKEAFL